MNESFKCKKNIILKEKINISGLEYLSMCIYRDLIVDLELLRYNSDVAFNDKS